MHADHRMQRLVLRAGELAVVVGAAARLVVTAVMVGPDIVVEIRVLGPQTVRQRPQRAGNWSYAATVDAQVVAPPQDGRVTARRIDAFGIRSTNETSVCQLLAAPSIVSSWDPRDVTVGCGSVGAPSSSAKAY